MELKYKNPKWDKELLGKIDIHDLIHYDELMKSGMLDRFEL